MAVSARRRNWLLISVVLAFILALRLTGSVDLPETSYFAGQRPYVIAHQGGDGLRPGNTMLAFSHADKLGVDVLEMDVHATRDGALVLMHDDAVDRTTNGTGRLADMDLATVQSLDAAYHWPFDGNPVYRGKGVRVPLLADVLERFPRQRFNIEIKADSKPLAEALCGVLHQTAREPVALVASFHRTALQHFRTVCPDVATSTSQAETTVFLLFSALWLDRLYRPVAGALQVPLERFGIPLSSEAMIASAARHGMYLDVWTLNGEAAIEAAYARGVSGVITDRPDLAMAVRNRLRVEGVSAGGGDP